MGIKTNISIDKLPKKYKQYRLIETIDGVSDTVYLLDDKYVVKIFENSSKEQINNEYKLLNELKNINVPKVVDIFQVDKKYAAIYTCIGGASIKSANLSHIKQIGVFLNKLHEQTSLKTNTNKKLFSVENLKILIDSSKQSELLNYFNNINITLNDDGLIHGDIFLDNVKFKDDILSGVYDFSEVCEGDFHFDLAVVSISWCFDQEVLNYEKLNALLKSYNTNIDLKIFIEYIKYALLYYATIRFITNRDFTQLARRIEKL